MRRIQTLGDGWGTHGGGEIFEVLEPREEIRPGTVDAGRANQLLADKLAEELPDDWVPAVKKSKAKRGAARG